MSRPDQSITFLKDQGYSVLRMPRSDTKPLQTLLRSDKKDLVRLGELGAISTAGSNAMPGISADNPSPVEISGKESSSVKIEIGVNILGNIIKAFGGNTLGVTAAYNKAKTLTFKFENVTEDHCDVDRLDQYLSTASFRLDGKMVVDALIDDEVYIITSTLKTSKFTVNAQGDSGAKIGVEVPVVSKIASGSLDVDTTHATQGTVSYEGKVPVIFGFQAVQVFADEVNGRPVYSLIDPIKAGSIAARELGRPRPTLLKLDQGVFFRLEERTKEVGGRE